MIENRQLFEVLSRNFGSLLILQTAVDCGSFNRAATQLDITQPAVSRCISRLEDALSCKLVERSASGVKPTEYGEIVLEHFGPAAKEMRQASKDLSLLRRNRIEAVACGGAPANIEMIADAASRVARDLPEAMLHIYEGATPSMLGLLISGDLDIVVGSQIYREEIDGIVVEDLFDEQIGIFASGTNPLAKAGVAEIDDMLAHAQWVMPDSGTHLYEYIHSLLSNHGAIAPTHLIESRSTTVIRWLVKNTNYLAFSTDLVHSRDLESGAVVEVNVDWKFDKTKHALYRRPNHAMSKAASVFAQAIREVATPVSA